MSLRKRGAELVVLCTIVALDQASKAILQASLQLHEYKPLLAGVLSISHVRNRGAAFGLLNEAGLPFQGVLLSGISFVALAAIAVYALRLPEQARLPRVALALVLGGAIGNLIDRIRYGYVVDFIHVYWKQHQWPDFNLADSAISVGVALLILDILLSPHRNEPVARAATQTAGRTD
jgi:signal peptidase II